MFKISRIASLLIFFFIFSSSYAQTYADSLKAAYKTCNDKEKYTVITHLFHLISPHEKDYDYYVEQTKILSDRNLAKPNLTSKQKQFWLLARGDYYLNKAIVLESDNPSTALEMVNKSIPIFTQIKNNRKLADALMGAGTLLRNLGRTPEALEFYYKGLKIYEKDNDKSGVAYAQTIMANVYNDQQKYEVSLGLYKKALAYYSTVKEPTMDDSIALAALYQNIGHYYLLKGKDDIALSYFNNGLAEAKKINYTPVMSPLLEKIARIHFKRKQYDLANQEIQEVLKLDQPEIWKANLYITIGEFCIEQKKFKEAEEFLKKANAIGKEHQDLDTQMYAMDFLNRLYTKTKQFEKALKSLNNYYLMSDSISNDESRNSLKEQQLKYNFEKKELKGKIAQEKKISALKLDAEKKTAAKNNLLIGLSGILLLVLLGGYFYYRNNKQRQAINALEKNQIKQKLLITQMNPHFIFNSIENIQALIYDKKEEEAADYLTKFSILTRQILENSNENYILLSEEVEMIKNYLFIQQLLYNNKFDFTITVEDTIDPETIFLPPMLTQPFIENAIKHGLSNTTENGLVAIHFFLKEAKLFFEVSDNGKGFDTTAKTTNHKSLAMTITKERLINYTKNQDFVVQTANILDKDTNVVGAKVVFEIPYIYEN
ncbi:tetratricopeptide repeat-containing sensor histidine kinase [Flavobacterium phycosphaerae]|uniref:tetratricopeptide repeat-containing sensor histidine kinase n=1 Tax=Flavobacterium phycosphaerae TaxID=2697515 RepID=UPI001389A99F|nr:histidine kinase [Flavobacterium phycosphaerae]